MHRKSSEVGPVVIPIKLSAHQKRNIVFGFFYCSGNIVLEEKKCEETAKAEGFGG